MGAKPSLVLALGLTLSLAWSPAAWAGLSARDLERLGAVARTEGLPLVHARSLHGQVALTSSVVLDKASFIRRSSLVAYVLFKRLTPPADEVAVEAKLSGGGVQRLRIRRTDLEAYLSEGLSRSRYEEALAYRTEAPRPTALASPEAGLPPPQALPEGPATASPNPAPMPDWQGPEGPVAQGEPVASPAPAAWAWPTWPWLQGLAPAGRPMLGMSYALGLAPAPYDGYDLEYAHPLRPWLDARAGLLVWSGMSPVNAYQGARRPVDGLAGHLDLMATTRQVPGQEGWSVEGGLGLRVIHGSSLGAVPLGPLFSSSLRLGLRWGDWQLGLRYPLWRRADDPGSSWELSAGRTWPFSTFGAW